MWAQRSSIVSVSKSRNDRPLHAEQMKNESAGLEIGSQRRSKALPQTSEAVYALKKKIWIIQVICLMYGNNKGKKCIYRNWVEVFEKMRECFIYLVRGAASTWKSRCKITHKVRCQSKRPSCDALFCHSAYKARLFVSCKHHWPFECFCLMHALPAVFCCDRWHLAAWLWVFCLLPHMYSLLFTLWGKVNCSFSVIFFNNRGYHSIFLLQRLF